MLTMLRITLAIMLVAGSIAPTIAAPDTIYNQRGQAVQAEAPNYFQTLTDVSTWVDLDASGGTLYWSLYVPAATTTCTVRITATQSKSGTTPFSIPASTRDGYGKGWGMRYVNFTGCANGQYKAMRGNWENY